MALFLTSPLSLPSPCTQWKLKQESRLLQSSRSRERRIGGRISRNISFNARFGSRNGITAFFFNPAQDPIVKEALKEPVAFFGGIFAGILRLDLNEEPLKEWVTRTAEAAGITKEEEINAEGSTTEAAPQEIEIE